MTKLFSNWIECDEKPLSVWTVSASYLHSERGAGTASCLERHGAGQQYWCKAFTYLRHKEKQTRHTPTVIYSTLQTHFTPSASWCLDYSGHCFAIVFVWWFIYTQDRIWWGQVRCLDNGKSNGLLVVELKYIFSSPDNIIIIFWKGLLCTFHVQKWVFVSDIDE